VLSAEIGKAPQERTFRITFKGRGGQECVEGEQAAREHFLIPIFLP